MALKRLLLGICALSIVFTSIAVAQYGPTQPNQDGILIMDALGRFFSAPLGDDNIGPFIFWNLESQNLGFTFPVAKDIELVGDPNGSPIGAYVLDSFGGQHTLNLELEELPEGVTGAAILSTAPAVVNIPTPVALGQNNLLFSQPPFWDFDVAEDLEIAPDWRETTFGYKGYFVLDADGVVHPLGETNLPSYVYYTDPSSDNIEDATIVTTLFPATINVNGSSVSANDLLLNGPLDYPVNRLFGENQSPKSVTPIFTYFGPDSDIARDLEISVEYVQVTVPSRTVTAPAAPGSIETRNIAMTNGYYIMDGYGAVHSARLPLDFDVNNDGLILYTDMYEDFTEGKLNPDFGEPINNVVLSIPWANQKGDLPYFGSDVAVDLEITPSGRGFFLLDAYGSVFAIGDAHFNFPPIQLEDGTVIKSDSTPTFFGVRIARDLAIVPNLPNPDLNLPINKTSAGLLVIDMFGGVHEAGVAQTFEISERGNNGSPISAFADLFRAVETAPLWLPAQPDINNFKPNTVFPAPKNFVVDKSNLSSALAPNFRNVTAAFKEITAPAD